MNLKRALVLAAVALVARLVAIILLRAWEHPNPMECAALANSFLQGKGLSFSTGWGYYGLSAVQSPTYPLVLVSIFWLFGVNTPAAFAAAMVFNAILGACTALVLWFLVKEIGGSATTAWIAAFLFCIWPSQLYLVAHAQAIAITTACVATMSLMFLRARREPAWQNWLIYSLAAALGGLTEPVLLPVVGLSGLWVLFWGDQHLRVRLRGFGILSLCVLVFQGTWIIRNYMAFGRFVPTKSTVWCNIWKTSNSEATGTDRQALSEDLANQLRGRPVVEAERMARETDSAHQYDLLTEQQIVDLTGRNEIQQDDLFRVWALKWIGENPGGYFRLCAIRFIKTVWIDWDNPKAQTGLYSWPRTLLLALAVVGTGLAIRAGWHLGFIALLVGCVVATHTVVITAARFSLPLEPLALAVSSLTVFTICNGLSRRVSLSCFRAVEYAE